MCATTFLRLPSFLNLSNNISSLSHSPPPPPPPQSQLHGLKAEGMRSNTLATITSIKELDKTRQGLRVLAKLLERRIDWLGHNSQGSFGRMQGSRIAVIVDGNATQLQDLVKDLELALEEQLIKKDVWWIRVDGEKVETLAVRNSEKGGADKVGLRHWNQMDQLWPLSRMDGSSFAYGRGCHGTFNPFRPAATPRSSPGTPRPPLVILVDPKAHALHGRGRLAQIARVEHPRHCQANGRCRRRRR